MKVVGQSFNDRDNFKGLDCSFEYSLFIKKTIFTGNVALIHNTRFGLYGGQKVIVVNFATNIEEKTVDIGDFLLPAFAVGCFCYCCCRFLIVVGLLSVIC